MDDNIKLLIEDAILEAEIEADEERKAKEKRRRATLSPRRKQLQALADTIDANVHDWDDEAYGGQPGRAGTDHKTLWAAVRGLAALERSSPHDANITRWFASWVKNRLIAAINTEYDR